MWNVISERVLCIPRIYSSLREGRGNEDRRYALLLLAMEVVSFIMDLFGGSQWGYLLASFLLSALILKTTIYAYFIEKSTIFKSKGQQLIAVEIVFSVLQLIISGYCLIKTLSGVETNYSSSVFPLAYATISAVFTFKRKKDVLHLSSNTPSNQVGIVEGTGKSELESIRVDPRDPTLVSVPASDANVDPPDPTLVSVPDSEANVGPPDPSSVSVPDSEANVGPPDPKPISNVDPPDPTLVPVPASDAKVPHANKLRRRSKQTQISFVNVQTGLQNVVFKVDLPNDKKYKAFRSLLSIPGVDSIRVGTKGENLTLNATGEVDLEQVLNKLGKLCNTELISVGPAEQPKTREGKQSVEKKNSEGQIWP